MLHSENTVDQFLPQKCLFLQSLVSYGNREVDLRGEEVVDLLDIQEQQLSEVFIDKFEEILINSLNSSIVSPKRQVQL